MVTVKVFPAVAGIEPRTYQIWVICLNHLTSAVSLINIVYFRLSYSVVYLWSDSFVSLCVEKVQYNRPLLRDTYEVILYNQLDYITKAAKT